MMSSDKRLCPSLRYLTDAGHPPPVCPSNFIHLEQRARVEPFDSSMCGGRGVKMPGVLCDSLLSKEPSRYHGWGSNLTSEVGWEKKRTLWGVFRENNDGDKMICL